MEMATKPRWTFRMLSGKRWKLGNLDGDVKDRRPPIGLFEYAFSEVNLRRVCVFLERYIVWCARRRHIGELRSALGLLSELARGRLPGS